MSLFPCWYFLAVIVQVLGPILARCWFGNGNETTRFHQSDLWRGGGFAARRASAAGGSEAHRRIDAGVRHRRRGHRVKRREIIVGLGSAGARLAASDSNYP